MGNTATKKPIEYFASKEEASNELMKGRCEAQVSAFNVAIDMMQKEVEEQGKTYSGFKVTTYYRSEDLVNDLMREFGDDCKITANVIKPKDLKDPEKPKEPSLLDMICDPKMDDDGLIRLADSLAKTTDFICDTCNGKFNMQDFYNQGLTDRDFCQSDDCPKCYLKLKA
jgi:6-phosphogluconate dehydrogenase